MSETGGNHQRIPKLALAFAGIGVMGLLLWFTLSPKHDATTPGVGSSKENGSEVLRSKSDRRVDESSGIPEKTTAGKRPNDLSISEEGEDGPQFPQVDEILADDRLSNEDAAARLLSIVGNKQLSVLEREEALSHGLNLDFPRFVDLVADPELPQPLAQRFFDEMLNHNNHRNLQVKACISLMDHDNEAMRQDAAEQLGFYIGMEEWSDKPEELKQEAQAFLEDLAKRPVSEPEPADPDADIPETAPINPLEIGEMDDEEEAGESEEKE